MRYKLLGNTGVRISEIVLGTANFGQRWGHGADQAESTAILTAYADAGGNFIDTADVYQFGQSEEILGTILEARREDFFLASKFTSGAAAKPNRLVTGNSRRAMVASVESSLKRLRTDRIDLYWVHHPDAAEARRHPRSGRDRLGGAPRKLAHHRPPLPRAAHQQPRGGWSRAVAGTAGRS